jgi:hypothetical protein
MALHQEIIRKIRINRKKAHNDGLHPGMLPTLGTITPKPDGTISASPIGRRLFPLQRREYVTHVVKDGMKHNITTVKARRGKEAIQKAREALVMQGTK